MPSQGVISTGSCIAFSATAPATFDVEGFDALTWTDDWIEVTQYGSVGPSTNIATANLVCTGEVVKRPGSKDFGTMSISAISDESNPNQALLQDAIDATPVESVYVRFTLSSGAVRYFKAYPGSLVDEVNDADSWLTVSVELAVDGAYLRKAPA